MDALIDFPELDLLIARLEVIVVILFCFSFLEAQESDSQEETLFRLNCPLGKTYPFRYPN